MNYRKFEKKLKIINPVHVLLNWVSRQKRNKRILTLFNSSSFWFSMHERKQNIEKHTQKYFRKFSGNFIFQRSLIGQYYDGTGVISGHLNRFQKKSKHKAAQADLVNCLAFTLFENCLTIQPLKYNELSDFICYLLKIPSFFYHSAKNLIIIGGEANSNYSMN